MFTLLPKPLVLCQSLAEKAAKMSSRRKGQLGVQLCDRVFSPPGKL
uniref:Uncharacterized protein n=1 Tax=Anguilla anguilla TaxID=7936 RepID=A0A0E9V9I0_ANGAN